MKVYRSLYERLVASTQLQHDDNPQSCWLWTGARRGHYPCLPVRIPGGGRATKPRNVAAHRAMIEEVHGVTFPHDEGGHLCCTPLCIHPDHLEAQTQAANLDARRGRRPLKKAFNPIPVLYPREEMFVPWDEPGTPGQECPF